MRWRPLVPAAVTVAGLAFVVVGVAEFVSPAAWIVAGVFVVSIGVLASYGKGVPK